MHFYAGGKVQKVAISNPLTLIALFAGIAETSAVTVLPFLEQSVQTTFVWFVMVFPCLLVILFFVVLWARSSNLYAPTDYRDDETYVKIQGVRQSSQASLLSDLIIEGGTGLEDGNSHSLGDSSVAAGESSPEDRGKRSSASDASAVSNTENASSMEEKRDEEQSSYQLKQSSYRLKTPAPTPRIAQATLELGEAAMAESLALKKIQAFRGGVLTAPATVSVQDGAYQFDGVLVQGRSVEIVEVIYKRGQDISSKVKSQLQIFRRIKRQLDSEGDRTDISFLIAVVVRQFEDFNAIDSLVRGYAKKLEVEVEVEVFDLKMLMSDVNL
jgi:hypothetical protein